MAAPLIVVIFQIALVLLGWTALATLALLVHECGHLAAHLVFGHRIVYIRVGPIEFRPPGSWSWIRHLRKFGSGGVLAQLRKLPDKWTPYQEFLAVLAGPLANISTALALLPFSFGYNGFSAICGWFASVSVLFALAQLAPFRVGAVTSDGAKLFWILFNRKRRDELVFLLSFSVRLQDLAKLVREKRIEEAIGAADGIITKYKQIPSADLSSEHFRRLEKYRDTLEAHRDCGDVCKVEASS